MCPEIIKAFTPSIGAWGMAASFFQLYLWQPFSKMVMTSAIRIKSTQLEKVDYPLG
jgi:hypothetical protein